MPDRHEGAEALAEELGDLPLALAQSAAYIADNEFLTCASYLDRLRAGVRPLHALLPEELPDAHEGTVVAVLELSLRHANRARPVGLAEPLLVFASMLSPEGVPLVLLTAPATLGFLEGFTGADVTPELVMDALATMHRLNLITLDAKAPHATVRVHALLRRVAQERFPADRLPDLFYAGVVAVVEVRTAGSEESPEILGAVDQCGSTLHVLATEPPFRSDGAPYGLLTRHNLTLGVTLGGLDHLERIHVLRQEHHGRTLNETRRVVERRLRELGADHRDTLAARHHLARMLGEDNHVHAAVELLEQLVGDYHRVMGADYPHTLTARHNLVYWRARAGDRDRALAEAQTLVADRERVLGPAHPHTIASRYNLGYLREERRGNR